MPGFFDRYPKVYKRAEELIPHIWGTLRSAWMKGYLLKDVPEIKKCKFVRTSAAETYFRLGKLARKTDDEKKGE